ncbi:SIS domain-containing protein [Kineococcus vitellinus]|uniref:SIS domain-containing protein n=1 Tax=Kineococcus vitellinus TaxID=2696565 RepID=UPI003B839E07
MPDQHSARRFPAGEEEQLQAAEAQATAREIAQQPQVWRHVQSDSRTRESQVRAFLEPLLAQPQLRIILSGAGTSAFVGDILAPALTRALGRRVDAVATTDVVADPRAVFAEDLPTLFVSFARSGDSPESMTATELADRCLRSVHHLVLTCNPHGRLAREHTTSAASHVLLMPEVTNDRGFAMTSSFTSMLLAGWLALAPDARPPRDEQHLEHLVHAGEQALCSADQLSALAARGYERVVYLGSGVLAGLARESALKLLELTAGEVLSFFDTPLGFRHGPKSMLRTGTLAVVFRSSDPYTQRYDDDIVTELQSALGAEHVLVVGSGGPATITLDGADQVPDVLLALPYAVIAQLLALRFALAHGGTPDNPFPSGVVNRVVRGVSIHPLDDAGTRR